MNWMKNKTEYKIGLWSLAVFLLIGLTGLLFGFETFPLGYLQKFVYAGMGVSIFWMLTWFLMEKSRPVLKRLIDPDDINEKLDKCSAFQQLQLGFFFFALIFWGFVYLASHL